MTWRKLVVSAATILSSTFYLTVHLEEKHEKTDTAGLDYLTTTSHNSSKISFEQATKKAEQLCLQIKEESGTPGLTVSVTIDGKPAFNRGYGFADVENHVECNSQTVMRIASISKSLTMAVVAKLWQNGQLSFDLPVQHYVSTFPKKCFGGEEVVITLRHLVSHLSGIRHYEKVEASSDGKISNKLSSSEISQGECAQEGKKKEFENKEYLINNYYESVTKSLSLFQDDELHSKPGSKFLYTTHGWTLVSAVVESIVEKPFDQYMKSFFQEMGLKNTYLDENKPIIPNRARYYVRNTKGRLENATNVDNSYKWAGGGFLSTSEDLTKFGNAMLYSFQNSDGFLNQKTVEMIWTPVENTEMSWDKGGKYGMGWGIVPPYVNYPFCNIKEFYVSHTGGAIGASSVLLIYPRPRTTPSKDETPVRGIVVAMIANMQSVGLNKTAFDIAQIFENVDV